MQISRMIAVLDAADVDTVSSFWSRLLGGTVERQDGWHSIYVDGELRLDVQLAPDHVPPGWPNGPPQQVHLDLFVEDIDTAHAEAMDAGARLLQAADMSAASGFQVYADPAGHPFCLCWSR